VTPLKLIWSKVEKKIFWENYLNLQRVEPGIPL